MGYLGKDEVLFNRAEDGSLLPQDVKLELLDGDVMIKARPLTRGKLQEIDRLGKSETIGEQEQAEILILKDALVEPLLTEEEIKAMKPAYKNAISIAIMAISLGMEQKELQDKTTNMIAEQEYGLKKKL